VAVLAVEANPMPTDWNASIKMSRMKKNMFR
jgi:hypothetical protein